MEKILIIDDDVQLCTALQVRLEKENYRVLIVDRGRGALETAEGETPNLILLDLAMPDMDGIEVLHQLKHNVLTWDIPVMVVTAKGDFDDRERSLRLGATRYIQKPLTLRELVTEISRLLRPASVSNNNLGLNGVSH